MADSRTQDRKRTKSDGRASVLRSGADAYFAGELEVAIRIMRRALDDAPDEAAALLIIAHAGFRSQNWKIAAEAADRLVAAVPGHADAIAIAAVSRARLGAWDEAAARYRKLLAADSHTPAAKAALSGILGTVGRWGDAAKRYRDTLALDRQRVTAEIGLIRALDHAGQWPEAAERAHAIIAEHPDHLPALVLALKSAIALGQIEQSLGLWIRLAQGDPQSVIRWIRVLERQDRFDWAVQAFRGLAAGRGTAWDVLIEHSRLAGALARRAVSARQAGDASLAVRADHAALSLPPMHPGDPGQDDGDIALIKSDRELLDDSLLAPILGAELTARIRNALDRPLGKSDHRPSRKAEPSGPDAGARLAPGLDADLAQIDAALAKGALDAAAEAIAELERRFPGRVRVRQAVKRLARARLQAARDAGRDGRHDEVIAMLAGRETPPSEHNEVDALLARAYMAKGELASSLVCWRRVAEAAPDNAKAWTYIARCCRSLKLWEEARAAASRKLALEPDDAKTRSLLEECERNLAKT